ncbi:MAG: DUF3465 domain-containing protein [Gammaproteobacteria bacterium]|nr:DUF3465 domain-containing protein [Gammaproteobacteria bacterium]
MKKLILIVAIAAAAVYGLSRNDPSAPPSATTDVTSAAHDGNSIARAFEYRRSNIQVEGQGTVTRILPDDADGSRHQRFILRLDSGQSLLIAHNIDLAPRIDDLGQGDRVAFHGEYEWNQKGGVIHWTHHDPDGSHQDGWIRHDGRIYQ